MVIAKYLFGIHNIFLELCNNISISTYILFDLYFDNIKIDWVCHIPLYTFKKL